MTRSRRSKIFFVFARLLTYYADEIRQLQNFQFGGKFCSPYLYKQKYQVKTLKFGGAVEEKKEKR